ncbi:MAG TPA: hypothetical protein VFU94_10800 [Conexibacter sp.]|nr:hypothetical protein [Conexibacter sp.]
MSRSPRRAAALGLLAALCAVGCLAGAAAARVPNPVRITAAFDRAARLGGATPLDVTLRLDPAHLTIAPLTEIRFAYPQELGLVSSGLGLASCVRPASDFAAVLIQASGLGGCSPNAVMGYGDAQAVVRLVGSGQVIREVATVTLLSGAFDRGQLGLVVYVDGQRPFGAKLAFAGTVADAPAPYGGALDVRMPSVPGLEDLATVSLVELRIVIGARSIRYYERRRGRVVSYHPGGVELPSSCPRGGFRFRADVRFADGSRRSATSITRCPPAVVGPGG